MRKIHIGWGDAMCGKMKDCDSSTLFPDEADCEECLKLSEEEDKSVKHEIKYILIHKESGKTLGFTETTNGPDAYCCGESTVSLDIDSDRTWFAESPLHAGYVRDNSTPWYNSDHRTPMHCFEADELKVCKVEVILREGEIPADLPTKEQYWRWKYEKKNPEHLKMLLREDKKSPISYPLLHEIEEYIKDTRKFLY